MRRKHRYLILFSLLLILFSSTVCHAVISKPKNFRIVMKSEKGTVFESQEWSVYAVQQVFLDKMSSVQPTYIDSKGYEYNFVGYRLMTWSGNNYSGKASADTAMTYNEIVAALRRAYDTLDPPYSMQVTLAYKATGNKYSTDIPVHVIWLNQNSELVKEETQHLGLNGIYKDKAPKEYEIISVEATMTDIWNVGSEITIDQKSPSVKYNKFAKEYRIVYMLKLTPEQEAKIMNAASAPSEEKLPETTAAVKSTESAAETTAATETKARPSAPSINTVPDSSQNGTVTVPTQTDESYNSGSNRITLIIGLVIGIAVIYLIVIMIGSNSKKKKPKRKNRL